MGAGRRDGGPRHVGMTTLLTDRAGDDSGQQGWSLALPEEGRHLLAQLAAAAAALEDSAAWDLGDDVLWHAS